MDVSVIITSPPLAKTVPAPAGPDRRRDGLVVAHQEAAELKGRPGAG